LNIRPQQRQVEQPADEAAVDLPGVGNLRDRAVFSRLQHPIPPVRPRVDQHEYRGAATGRHIVLNAHDTSPRHEVLSRQAADWS
jgi:hypothetical protein